MLIIDTDVGGNPDDAIALTIAARTAPELTLVVTSDEHAGQRARLARHLLDLAGRPDVPVVAGTELAPAGRLWVAVGLTPERVPNQPYDVPTAVADLLDRHPDRTHTWLGLGPLTNLAEVLHARPAAAGQLRVVQMGGALNYRDPGRAERNFCRDPATAADVLAMLKRPPALVTSDVTHTPELELTPGSDLAHRWTTDDAPGWARLLADHLQQWTVVTGHPGSILHDPAALCLALGGACVTTAPTRVDVDDLGRMRCGRTGAGVFVAVHLNHLMLWDWVEGSLNPDRPAVDRLQAVGLLGPPDPGPEPRHHIMVEVGDNLLRRIRSFADEIAGSESEAIRDRLEEGLASWPWTFPPKDRI